MKDQSSNIFYYLLSHKDFRDWVKAPNEERDLFWHNWLEQHPEERKAFFSAREAILRIKFKQERLSERILDEMLGEIIAADDTADPLLKIEEKSLNATWLTPWMKVAAILVLSFVTAALLDVYLKPLPQVTVAEAVEWKVVENPKGRKSKVVLPDGTVVNLNYESQLSFPTRFSENLREVKLIGEAFFEVERDENRPFIVSTGAVETEVLGTSFNIRFFERENFTQVSLVTGEVKVNYASESTGSDNKLLAPGEALHYNHKSQAITKNTFDTEAVIGWKDGVMIFRNSGFEDFIDQLEQWYGVDFHVYGHIPKDWKVNGRYDNERLEDILLGMKFIYEMDYKIQGKKVTMRFLQ